MTSIAYIQFVKGLENKINKTFGSTLESVASQEQVLVSTQRNNVRKALISPEFAGSEIYLSIPKINSERNLIKYAILSWFISPLARFELQEILNRKSEKSYYCKVGAYLHSKEIMLFALFVEKDFKHGDLFGNILTRGVSVSYKDSTGKTIKVQKDDFIKLQMQKRRKAIPKVFRRGYDDKGSRPPLDVSARRRAFREDYSTTLKQLKIEERRNNFHLQSEERIVELICLMNQIFEEGVDN